jgi:hypothetical protein
MADLQAKIQKIHTFAGAVVATLTPFDKNG